MSRKVLVPPPPAEELATPTAFPAGKCQEQPAPKRVPVPWLCLPIPVPMPCSPCPGSETSAQLLGLLGPRLRVLGACLGLMAPVFTFYYSPAGGEKENWERSESFSPPPPPPGAPVSPGMSPLSPGSLGWRGPGDVEAPASAYLTDPVSLLPVPCPSSW